jgi:formylglycine-generating enzyme required for sulfatase activity
MGHLVFISYSSKDRVFANAIVSHLERNGIACWIAPRDILAGTTWAGAILKAIEESKLMVLVFSDHTNVSQQVHREVERALFHGIPVAPVRIEDVLPSGDLEFFLSAAHWMDAMSPPFERHLQELARVVKLLLKLPAGEPDASASPNTASPLPPMGLSRQRNVLILVIAVVLLTALILFSTFHTSGNLSRTAPGVSIVSSPAPVATFAQTRPMIAANTAPTPVPQTITPTAPVVTPIPLAVTPTTISSPSVAAVAPKMTTPAPKPPAPRSVTPTPAEPILPNIALIPPDAAVQIHAARVAELSSNWLGMKFVEIKPTPPEGFQMGTPIADPDHPDEVLHTVDLSKGFMMGAYHVTRGQFAAFVTDTSYRAEGDNDKNNWRHPGFEQGDDHPVVCVTWNDARKFCEWLHQKDGRHYRLPTEAEWEYACRAGAKSAYFWGDDASQVGIYAWYEVNAPNGTMPVGQKRPNNWGLYDMCGDAWQRCEDGYGDYPTERVKDPQGVQGAIKRVARGGAWGNPVSYFRCANRGRDAADYRNNNLGFRVCLDF